MNTSLLIVNPVRGTQTAKQVTRIEETLQGLGVRYDLAFTGWKGHGIELARRGVREGYATIVGVGGDGTVNEVVNGVGGSRAAVFSIPLGASNDFLRSLGIWTWEQACCALAEEGFTYLDLGLAEYRNDSGHARRRFYAVLGDVGFGSDVVHNAPRRFRHALGGGLGYVVSLYRTAVQGRAQGHRMRVTVDGGVRYDEKLLLVEALNGTYAGGGLKVAPSAKMDDGLLDMLVVKDVGWWKIWTLFPKVYRGTHVDDLRTDYFTAREVEIETDRGTRVSIDGEVIGWTPVRFSVIPGALKVRRRAAVG